MAKEIKEEIKEAIITVHTQFLMGQSVYLKTDNQQLERYVVGIMIRPTGISYALAQGTNESWHYALEISEDRDIVKATSS